MEYNKEFTQNSAELNAHFSRNEKMWESFKERGIKEETEFTILFHFYASRKENMLHLCQELTASDISFDKKETRTFIFLKGWKVDAKIKQSWSLPKLQGKTGNMFLLSQQTGVSLEGCGAFLPNG